MTDDRPEIDALGRNLALELMHVTEAAALAAARFIGLGDKEAADQAAVDAMRLVLGTLPMAGVVVIGEGEKDDAPLLFDGEEVGGGEPPEVDIAVDPLEGVRYQKARGATTESLVMRSRSGTVRRIRATHDRRKLSAVTGHIDF